MGSVDSVVVAFSRSLSTFSINVLWFRMALMGLGVCCSGKSSLEKFSFPYDQYNLNVCFVYLAW